MKTIINLLVVVLLSSALFSCAGFQSSNCATKNRAKGLAIQRRSGLTPAQLRTTDPSRNHKAVKPIKIAKR